MKSLSRLAAFLKPYQGSITPNMVLLVCLGITDLSIVQTQSFSFGYKGKICFFNHEEK
jgi:hypothetical protein